MAQQVVLEEWISQFPHLKDLCERIKGKRIKPRTWREWEKLVGACYPQGKKISDRVYTDEQTRLFLCLAWMRKLWPNRLISYRTLRTFYQGNNFTLEEVFNQICDNPVVDKPEEPSQVSLAQVKACCDQILGRNISRECWSRWKQHLGIAKRSKAVDKGMGSLLVYVACWRHDHPTDKLPSLKRLTLMMMNNSRSAMQLDTASSNQQLREWQSHGCEGRDLRKYLAACGVRVSLSSLYKRGFSRKKFYTPSELKQWELGYGSTTQSK